MRAIAEGLFTETDPPCLIGGRDSAGRLVFPRPDGDEFAPVVLGNRGTIWSFTIQRFRPKSPPYAGPDAFAPYAMAYIELPGELIVESRLTNVAFAAIAIDMPVEMTLIPLDPAAGEASVLIHAFQPVGGRP